ncbi:MAG: hypothetical protein VYE73_03125 [Acidobacteriota bacterium]|nr:hypothetical protein [Acidobacteriota bacterium]
MGDHLLRRHAPSYAQLGITPQMYRTEEKTYANVRTMLEAESRGTPPLANVPDLYLGKGVDKAASPL